MTTKVLAQTAVCLLLAVAACNTPNTGPVTPVTARTAGPSLTPSPTSTPTATPGPAAIGDIQLKTDIVEHGSTINALTQLVGTANLFQGDVLRLHNGGEGWLDFYDGLKLRIFNDSQLGVVVTGTTGSAPEFQLYVEDGGFTGQLTKPGSQAVFRTPGNATITVLGTEFYVAYDAKIQLTSVGNFHGTVLVESAGVQIQLAAGNEVVVPPGQPPGAQVPIAFTAPEFEQQARDLKSPVRAASHYVTRAAAGALAVGDDHACALTGGGLKCWGHNTAGQLGDDTTKPSQMPVDVVGLSGRVIDVAAGHFDTCAVIQDGTVQCWGSNVDGQLTGSPDVEASTKPIVAGGPGGTAAAVAPGAGFTCALTADGAVRCWGAAKGSDLGQLGDRSLKSEVIAISAGASRSHSCVVMRGGRVRCWGPASHGELGNGQDSGSAAPVDVKLKEPAIAVAAGQNHTCALIETGAVKCWGYNFYYELGNASAELHVNTPVDVEKLAGVVAITAGANHTCALTAAGAVKCWGDNRLGQLGNGTNDIVIVPADVNGLDSGVAAIAAGGDSTCALMLSGSVKCWGDNAYGQLGDGTTTTSNTPVDVIGLGPAK